MALAILRFLDSDDGKNRFQVELGSNRFYRYAIGGYEVTRNNGLVRLQEPIYTSPLIGPLPESNLGRTILEVPQNQFDRQHRRIQLTSFRTAEQVGPAISEIITVVNITPTVHSQNNQDLPVLSFSLTTENHSLMDKSLETVAFQYQEVPPVSEEMGLGGLLQTAVKGARAVAGMVAKAAPKIVNTVAKVAPAVLPQLTAGAGGTTAAPGQTAIDINQILTLLIPLLQQIRATAAQPGVTSVTNATVAPPATENQSKAESMALSAAGYAYDFAALIDQEYPDVRGASVLDSYYTNAYGFSGSESTYLDAYSLSALEDEYPDVHGLTLASSYSEEYTEAYSSDYAESMFLPALGGLLTALAPKLLSLTPHLLSAFAPQLGDLFSSLFRGGQQTSSRRISRMMGLDEDEDGEEQAVLVALSLAIAAATTPDLVFQRVGLVTLAFSEVTPVTIQGKSRFLYRQDRDISFPLTLNTPQPVKKARLQLLVKHPKTLKILLEQNYQIESATSGNLGVTPKISKEQLKTLAANEEYLVCVALVWQGRSKKTKEVMQLGTNTMQLITLVSEYSFDRIESTGQTVPLNDVDRFRPYWHKVWQGDFTDDLRRIEFQCKYYYTLENNRSENARLETVTQVLEDDMAGRKSRMKSGLILSPYGLNELLGQLGKHPRLSEAELSALVGAEFRKRFHHAARTEVKFKGKPGQTAALWVYLEVKLQQVILQKAENTNANGLVQALKDHPVYFPMPAVAHFIGVST